jgi:hypothetical protein
MGPYAGVDYNSPYLLVFSVVGFLSPPISEKGGVTKISPIGRAHLYLSDNFQNNQCEKGQSREGGGKLLELTLCL